MITALELSGSSTPTRMAQLLKRSVIGVTVVVGVVAAMSGTAFAATGETATGSTDAHVQVDSAIALTGLTANFTLTGLPGATVTGVGAVTMNVQTNNFAGYAVTVESATPTMVGARGTVANPNSIPIGALSVRKTGTTPYTAISNTATVTVGGQSTRSIEAGDAISNDYQVAIPFVNEDVYTATLDYIATTL
jgi:hypothetical protein